MEEQDREMEYRAGSAEEMEANHPEQTKEQEMAKKIAILAHSYMLGNETAANYEEGIFDAIKEAGYRLPAGKAPLLTKDERATVWQEYYGEGSVDILKADYEKYLCQAQNDADNK